MLTPRTQLFALLTCPFEQPPAKDVCAAIEKELVLLGYSQDESRFFALLAVRVRALDRWFGGRILEVGGSNDALDRAAVSTKA
jgi:hypothetical protein